MLDKLWYGKHPLRWCLWPFSLVYVLVTKMRRRIITRFCQKNSKVPLIIVGNISVGGVGKTPLVIALVEKIKAAGLKVGVVSRGYGASANDSPRVVKENDDPALVGDEPLLIAQKTACPVVIARRRPEAVALLEDEYGVDIIISDDGLQHYAMGRNIEIAVIDALRGLGNGLCLPAGPLRERPARLETVDFIIANGGEWSETFSRNASKYRVFGAARKRRLQNLQAERTKVYSMSLKPLAFKQLTSGKSVTAEALTGNITAIAAIGNPQRFFNSLKALGLEFNPRVFPDHYAFKPEDFILEETCLLMTEKDAVKCRRFAKDTMYALSIEAVLTEEFWDAFWSHKQLRGLFQHV